MFFLSPTWERTQNLTFSEAQLRSSVRFCW
jgi:hypothetical protein